MINPPKNNNHVHVNELLLTHQTFPGNIGESRPKWCVLVMMPRLKLQAFPVEKNVIAIFVAVGGHVCRIFGL